MTTIRQHMIALLTESELSPRQLSQALGIREKEVYVHLGHIERSALALNLKLVVRPYRCRVCGFIFRERKRFNRPGRCPRCKEGHLESAGYRIVDA